MNFNTFFPFFLTEYKSSKEQINLINISIDKNITQYKYEIFGDKNTYKMSNININKKIDNNTLISFICDIDENYFIKICVKDYKEHLQLNNLQFICNNNNSDITFFTFFNYNNIRKDDINNCIDKITTSYNNCGNIKMENIKMEINKKPKLNNLRNNEFDNDSNNGSDNDSDNDSEDGSDNIELFMQNHLRVNRFNATIKYFCKAKYCNSPAFENSNFCENCHNKNITNIRESSNSDSNDEQESETEEANLNSNKDNYYNLDKNINDTIPIDENSDID